MGPCNFQLAPLTGTQTVKLKIIIIKYLVPALKNSSDFIKVLTENPFATGPLLRRNKKYINSSCVIGQPRNYIRYHQPSNKR